MKGGELAEYSGSAVVGMASSARQRRVADA